MRRREFITTLGSAAALPLVGHAQQKMTRVGWLSPGSRTSDENFFASFRDGLRQLGWLVGQNIAIEPGGKFLYATQFIVGSRVFGYSIDHASGKLAPVGEPITLSMPYSAGVEPLGGVLPH